MLLVWHKQQCSSLANNFFSLFGFFPITTNDTIQRKRVFKELTVNHKNSETLPFAGDKSWFDSAKKLFICCMSHGPTPLTTMVKHNENTLYDAKLHWKNALWYSKIQAYCSNATQGINKALRSQTLSYKITLGWKKKIQI